MAAGAGAEGQPGLHPGQHRRAGCLQGGQPGGQLAGQPGLRAPGRLPLPDRHRTAGRGGGEQPGGDGKVDFDYPQGLQQYDAGTVVRGADGKRYQCKPYPNSGWCKGWDLYYARAGHGLAGRLDPAVTPSTAARSGRRSFAPGTRRETANPRNGTVPGETLATCACSICRALPRLVRPPARETTHAFSLAALQQAAAIVHQSLPPTPQIRWPLLCEALGCEVWMKHENHLPVGAFKLRGGLVYSTTWRTRASGRPP